VEFRKRLKVNDDLRAGFLAKPVSTNGPNLWNKFTSDKQFET